MRCGACGSTRAWRPRPQADPTYRVCAQCYRPPGTDVPTWRIADPPPALPPDRQGHRRCVCGCGALVPPGAYWHAPGADCDPAGIAPA